jgi:hypothetical protein
MEAADDRVLQVVRMIDSMVERGPADEMIAPLRPRLARLRPARPLTLDRLLFTIFDPIIVPAPRWRPGSTALPRTVLRSLAATVRAGLGEEARSIEVMVKGHTVNDRDVALRAGGELWPRAGEIIFAAPTPVEWETTGLNIALYPALARMVGTLLSEAVVLETLLGGSDRDPDPDPRAVSALLERIGARHPEALPVAIVLMVTRAPVLMASIAQTAAATLVGADFSLRPALDQAIETLTAQLEHDGAVEERIHSVSLTDVGATVRRMSRLLQHLGDDTAPAPRRERIKAIRRQLDTSCRSRFAEGLTTDFIAPLRSNPGSAGDDPVERLEEAARGLRALETEARSVGGGEAYDKLLRQAAEIVRQTPGADRIGRADKVRLVEILAGPEAALAMLEGAS